MTREKYDPELHPRHKTKYSLFEKVYLARHHAIDGETMIAAALERPTYVISTMINQMKRNGEWELYNNLTEEEYEKIVLAADRTEGRHIHEQAHT